MLLSTIKVDSVDGDWGCDKSKKKDKFRDLRGRERERETERWEIGGVRGTPVGKRERDGCESERDRRGDGNGTERKKAKSE